MTQQPNPAPCTAVLRAETGPCEACGFVFDHPSAEEVGVDQYGRGWIHALNNPSGTMLAWHPYLGPKIGVCGHEKDVHHEFEGNNWCVGCYDDDFEGEVDDDPSYHAFKVGETVDA